MRLRIFTFALTVLASSSALVAPAHAAGSASVYSATPDLAWAAYASVGSSVEDDAINSYAVSYTWYLCNKQTSFLSTRNVAAESNLADATETAINTELTDNECELSGAPDSQYIDYTYLHSTSDGDVQRRKPYVTFTYRITSPSFDFPVFAVANGAEIANVTKAPSIKRNGSTLTATPGIGTDVTFSQWFWCPNRVSAGEALVIANHQTYNLSNTPLKECKLLYSGFYTDDSGIQADEARQPVLDVTVPVFDEIGNETPVNLTSRYLVYVSTVNPIVTWSAAVPFDAEPLALRKNRTVYFKAYSAELTTKAKKALHKLVKASRQIGKIEKVRIQAFVHPNESAVNGRILSRARAKAVAKFLRRVGVRGPFGVYAEARNEGKVRNSGKAIVEFRMPESL